MCLKFLLFQAGRAYELHAYQKKHVSIILIDFMIAIAQKQGILVEKQKKIDENVVRVSYKRISTCSIRRLNLLID